MPVFPSPVLPGFVEVNVREPRHSGCPDPHGARRPYLAARGRIAAALRAWFAGRRFYRGRDRDLAGLARQRNPSACLRHRTDRTGRGAAAALLADLAGIRLQETAGRAGETRIFDFARVFRNRERGALHHPEFTMLEWYRANEPYETLMDETARRCWAKRRVPPAPSSLRSAQDRRSLCRAGARDGGGGV